MDKSNSRYNLNLQAEYKSTFPCHTKRWCTVSTGDMLHVRVRLNIIHNATLRVQLSGQTEQNSGWNFSHQQSIDMGRGCGCGGGGNGLRLGRSDKFFCDQISYVGLYFCGYSSFTFSSSCFSFFSSCFYFYFYFCVYRGCNCWLQSIVESRSTVI